MKKENITVAILGLISGILMSIPFLVPHTGFVALFAIVPLLAMERIATITGTKHFWLYHYLTFVLWNAITTFWVCNATIGGGIFAVIANAAQMSVVFALFRLFKKKFHGAISYIFLAAAWISWEKFYLDWADISWPWLVLGNSFARSIQSVQWYEYTGTLGGSLWIWACNLAIFGLMVSLSDGSFFERFNIKAKIASIAGLVILIAAPFITSAIIWHNYDEQEDPIDVFIAQPNIDPYHKFEALSQSQQDAILEGIIRQNLTVQMIGDDVDNLMSQREKPLLILAPETFTSYMRMDRIYDCQTWQRFTQMLKDYPGASMVFGASTYDYIISNASPSPVSRPLGDNYWLDSHNSAVCIDRTASTEIFHKSKLVVAVEMTPYPKLFVPIDNMLGGVMGRCIGQDEVSLLHCKTYNPDGSIDQNIPFGCAVCYESVYGNYYREYALKGARFMTVITNDAWWGNTPGYRQHLSYASLRAIESRRSIARCANTGISAIINQRGQITETTSWWEPASIKSSINMNDKQTFYTLNGDIVGRIAIFLFLLLTLNLVVHLINRH